VHEWPNQNRKNDPTKSENPTKTTWKSQGPSQIRMSPFTNETIYQTRRLDTRMLVTYGHQGVRSWDSNSRKTVEPFRCPSAKMLSKKTIKAFLGPVFDFGNRKQHTPFVHYVCFEKKNRDRNFRPWDFWSTFMRSKSCLVCTPRPYFRAEDNEPLVNKQHPTVWNYLNKCRTWTWFWTWRSPLMWTFQWHKMVRR
jgi:hypothetical protein